jgi:hypothetical protein
MEMELLLPLGAPINYQSIELTRIGMRRAQGGNGVV